jgi:16S rRNA (cytidine1402-2'-O)-methyltransferase
MREVLGDQRVIAVTRELTKLHEETWVGPLVEAVERWPGEVKGEVTIVVSPGEPRKPDLEDAVTKARELVDKGVPVSEASREVASATGTSRRAIYQALVDGQ